MGGFKGLKVARRVIEDCMKNVHPIYHIKARTRGAARGAPLGPWHLGRGAGGAIAAGARRS